MRILKNLVWDKRSGELIVFADLGDINVKCTTSMSWYFWLKCYKSTIIELCYISHRWNYSSSDNDYILATS